MQAECIVAVIIWADNGKHRLWDSQSISVQIKNNAVLRSIPDFQPLFSLKCCWEFSCCLLTCRWRVYSWNTQENTTLNITYFCSTTSLKTMVTQCMTYQIRLKIEDSSERYRKSICCLLVRYLFEFYRKIRGSPARIPLLWLIIDEIVRCTKKSKKTTHLARGIFNHFLIIRKEHVCNFEVTFCCTAHEVCSSPTMYLKTKIK